MSTPAPIPAFTPTPEQTAILDAVRDLQPGGLLKIQARAGTGKTTTLELLARADSRAMLYLAYNTDIAAAAKKRFPDTVTVKTTHGLAFSAMGIREWIPSKGAPRNVRSWELERWLKSRRWNPGLKTGASHADIAADLLATVRAFMQSADPVLAYPHARCVQKKTCFDAFMARAREDNNSTNTALAERDARASYGRYRDWLIEKAEAVWLSIIDRQDTTLPLEHDAYLKLYQVSQPRLDWPLILLDECFPSGTLVETDQGSVPIETIVDDPNKIFRILSSRDGGKTLHYSEVTSAYRTPRHGPLVRVIHEEGDIICTANHPVWIDGHGWKPAGLVCVGDALSCLRIIDETEQQILLTQMHGAMEGEKQDAGSRASASGEDQFAHEGGSDRDTEPSSSAGGTRKNISNNEKSRGHVHDPRREWLRADTVRTVALSGTGALASELAMEPRLCRIQWTKKEGHTDLLQDRRCFAEDEGSRRDRREVSSGHSCQGAGYQESRDTRFSRVVGVEVLERRSAVGCNCGSDEDYYVYTLAVRSGAYFADGILVKNCQDTNPCVMALFLSQSAAKVMVGDEAQAIYGFRGAVDALKTPGQEQPLLQSFRFGPAIAEVANQVLAFKTAYWSGFYPLRGDSRRASAIGAVTKPPYTVICRSNQGVFAAALKAASAGLGINSGAKDLEESICYVESAWALLVGRRLPKPHPEIAEFEHWAVLEQESQRDPALQWLVKLVTQHREDMPACCERLRKAKTRMKKSADVLVVTAHKSKGLEFDQVILADDFSALDKPLEKAIEAVLQAQGTPKIKALLEQLPEQELHLLYVAATRAQRLLQPNSTLKLMDKLSDALAKIRTTHTVNPLSVPESTAESAPQPPDAAEARRLMQFTYAAFPPQLKSAMKIAAKRFDWCPKTWVQQTEAIAEAMLTRGWTADELAAAYRAPPPPDRIQPR